MRRLGSVRRIVNQQLPARIKWLEEFLHDWNFRNGQQQKCDAGGDDIGPNSTGGEAARLHARIQELEHEKRRLEIENVGLRSEIGELKVPRAANPINSETTRH